MPETNLAEKEVIDDYEWSRNRKPTWWLLPLLAISIFVSFAAYNWPLTKVVKLTPAVRVPK